ncbi:MAG: replicative DNA helicase [Dysgonomonas sp.]
MEKTKNRNRTPQPLLVDIGRIQPQARELEEAVLGALLIESKAYTLVEDIIRAEDFYDAIHQIIYQAILNLSTKRKPIDMLTVVEELRTMGELESIGGPVYIAQLTDRVASAAHIEYHAQIIKQKSQARQLISITSYIQQKAFDETVDLSETFEEMEKSMTELMSNSKGSQSYTMPEALNLAIDKASEIQTLAQQGINPATTTGLRSLDDNFAGGWRAPDLVIIGARPSMGKTQLALHFAKAAASTGNHVLFISIEMTAIQLVNRYLLEDNRISDYNLRAGQMKEHEWLAIDEKVQQFWNLEMTIADSSEIRLLSNIKSEARKLHRKGNLKIMIIDYLQQIRTNMKFERRQMEVAYITGELKNLCKELDIPIILLSQLNRPPKGLSKKALAENEPKLDDLRESGDIEQDADKVLFIHKPDYYDPDAMDAKGEPWKNRGMLIIAKDREGGRNYPVIYYHNERYKKIWDKYVNINQETSQDQPPPEPSPIRNNDSFLSDEVPF